MKLTQLIVPALIVSSLSFPAISRAADAPTVDSILAKHIDASGGKAAMEKVSSRVIKFKLDSEALGSSEGEVFATVPNKQRSHIQLENAGAIDEGFDGTEAWAKSPWEALRVKAGDELAKVKRDAEFHRDLKLKELYPGLAYKGTEKVGDEEAYLLESKPSASSKEKLWFGTKSGLMVRQQSEFEGPQGAVNIDMLAQDYKTFDGLKYPGVLKVKVSVSGQNFEFTMHFTEVKHNVQVDAAKFAKPSA